MQGKCVAVEGSKFKNSTGGKEALNDDEEIITPIEHAYYVIEGPTQSAAAAESIQIEESGEEPLDLLSPLNDTSIHVRAADQQGGAVEILTKI